MNCSPCGKSFSGPVSYQQHVNSEKHQRKIATLGFFQGGNVEHSTSSSKSVGAYNQIACPVCDVSFDSLAHFQSHSLTLEHVSNVNKKHLDNTIDGSGIDAISSTTSSSNMLHVAMSEEKILFFKDETDAILPSDQSFEPPHFASGNELLNVALSGKKVQPEDETDTILPSEQSFEASHFASFAECKVCKKQFSGPEPYKQHMESLNHKKKVDTENFILQHGSPNLNESFSSRFSCDPCKKMFSGQVPYLQHMNSDLHAKKIRSIQLIEQFKENQNFETEMKCELNRDDQRQQANLDALQNMDVNRPWFCKFCLIQCSGLVPFNQHLQGDGHLKRLRRAEPQKYDIEPVYRPGGIVSTPIFNNKHTVTSVLHAGNKANINMETDVILPQALQNLSVLSADDLNVTEFLPDDEINFDDPVKKQPNDLIEKIDISENEQSEDTDKKDMNEIFEECRLCNVKLMSKDAALSHYESIEHFKKRWQSDK